MATIKKYELIFTDGCSIERIGIYATLEEASAMMHNRYDEYNANEPGDEWDKESSISDWSAVLYNNGENVYCWQILTFEI